MGREIRRVPLEFNWPLNKVWKGFVNPHYRECPEATKNNCHGGYTNAGKWLDAVCRLIAMLGQEAAQCAPDHQAHFKRAGRIYPHPYLREWGQAPWTDVSRDTMVRIRGIKDEGERMRALHVYLQQNPPQLLALDDELATLVQGLAPGEDLSSIGGMAAYRIRKTLIGAAGLDVETWGICKVCGGEGLDPAVKEVYENWQAEDPPSGDGWQVWETVSEGSPISPVFPSAEEVVRWLVDAEGCSELGARRFVDAGWCPSWVMTSDGQGLSGIDACAVVHGECGK